MPPKCLRCGSPHTETCSADGYGYTLIPGVTAVASSAMGLHAIPGMSRLIAFGLVCHLLLSRWLGVSRRQGDLYLVCRDCGHYAKL